MPLRTFQYRLYPTRSQRLLLEYNLAVSRYWYNMCLEDRKVAWEQEQRSVSKTEQNKKEKHYNQTFCTEHRVHSHVLQTATDDVDKAFQAFFRRVKTGNKKAGYPRFRSVKRHHSFGYKQADVGFKIDGRRLKLSFIGRIKVRWHRPIEGKIKTCRIVCKAGKWFVSFSCEVSEPKPLPKTERLAGIDVGVSKVITTSDGHGVENPNFYRRAQKRLRLLQRKLARAEKGSHNRQKVLQQVQRQHLHVKNQRQDFLDKLVHDLIHTFDFMALEDLEIKNMVKNKHLSKSIMDAGWGYFKQRIIDKAADAGREEPEFVNPANTSKTCSNCGAKFNDLTLTVRWVRCACGLSLNRDHNAAINILARGLEQRARRENEKTARTEPCCIT